MSDNVQSLWSDRIRPEILSPITILKGQAKALAMQTDGLLQAEINTEEFPNEKIVLTFDIVVPILDGYRHRILRIGHTKDFPYPCVLNAEVFSGLTSLSLQSFLNYGSSLASVYNNVSSDDKEFTKLLMIVLRSSQVLAIAQSLIARASDALAVEESQSQLPDSSSDISTIEGENADEE